jgi:hypothetical protein
MSSPSTLIRKARLAESRGHKSAGKRLREEAAKLRRAARKKKAKPAPKRKKVKKITKIENAIYEAFRQEVEAKSPLDLVVERVLGPDATPEKQIAMRRELLEARKAGENNAAAKYAALKEAHAAKYAALKEAHDISTVCGFIAICEHYQRLNGNLPPTMAVSGYMVSKLVDALRKAGYTRDGINGGGTTREAIGQRVSESRKEWRAVTGDDGKNY